jgi:DNA polymerase-4
MLIERFGAHGEHLFALANGIDPRPVVCEDLVKSISHEHTFDADCADPGEVERVIMTIAEKLSRRLRKEDLEGKTLTVKIRLKDFRTFTRAVTLGERTNHVECLYREGKNLFRQFYRRGMAIRLIGLRVTNFDDPYVKNSLFDDPQVRQSERVHHAVDQIKNRFGEDAIHRAL